MSYSYHNADKKFIVLLAATLPSSLVLFFVVLLTVLVVLCCIRANKRDNAAVKSKSDNRPKLTNEGVEEVYYATVGSKHDDKPEIEEVYYATVKSKQDDKPETTSNEIEEAYYTAVKGICNDGSKGINSQEVYYSTIGISTRAVDPQMEINCSYEDIRIHRMVN